MTRPTTARALFDEAFSRDRSPRSAAYRAGVLYALRARLEGLREDSPYQLGTAEADAFFAGCNEGHDIIDAMRRAGA